jgi:threonine synthase
MGEFAHGVVAGACVAGLGALLLQRRSALAARLRQYPKYVSTRGFRGVSGRGLDFEATVLTGLAPDGGLFVPTWFPRVSAETLDSWYGLDFQSLAFEVMSLYVPPSQVPAGKLREMIARSYGTFRHEQVVPVVRSGAEGRGPKVLELFHGPTFAFKDVALQFLGNLFEHFIGDAGKRITVLGATSGDTGSSAIYGLRGKKGVEVFILFPEGRVSPIQERQMTTVLDSNIHCVAVHGTFDDAQAIVKSMFKDAAANEKFQLAAINSINWARILAQIVYYFYAYLQVVPRRGSAGAPQGKCSFSVPTGNFGDILAGYYAKRMGLPVDVLIPATNANDIVHGFFSRGEYVKPAQVTTTPSPSMDICVSSNFERFLYHMASDDAAQLRTWMETFESTGKLYASPELHARAQAEMTSGRLEDDEIMATIKYNWQQHQYLLDPHSAIGVGVAAKLAPRLAGGSPVVCLACAHWGKFTDAVAKAIGAAELAQVKFPDALEKLKVLPTRKKVLPATVEAVHKHMDQTLGLGAAK